MPDELVEATLPHLSPTVAAMVRVQRLTGMRPQEVVLMRAGDIDRADPACWVYRPAPAQGPAPRPERLVFLGPGPRRSCGRSWSLSRGYLFSPRRAEEQRRAESGPGGSRRRRLPGGAAAEGEPEAGAGELYDDGAYRKAIRRACMKAGRAGLVPAPAAAHRRPREFRRRYGLEASQALLGHSELGTTQIYAEGDRERPRDGSWRDRLNT